MLGEEAHTLMVQSINDDTADGSMTLVFGEQSDPIARRLVAILLHLHSRDPQAAGKAAQLTPALEVCPIPYTLYLIPYTLYPHPYALQINE